MKNENLPLKLEPDYSQRLSKIEQRLSQAEVAIKLQDSLYKLKLENPSESQQISQIQSQIETKFLNLET